MSALTDFIFDALHVSKFSKVKRVFTENKAVIPLTRPVYNKDRDRFLDLYNQYNLTTRMAADCLLPENKEMPVEEMYSRTSLWLKVCSDIQRYHIKEVESPLKVIWFNKQSL